MKTAAAVTNQFFLKKRVGEKNWHNPKTSLQLWIRTWFLHKQDIAKLPILALKYCLGEHSDPFPTMLLVLNYNMDP